MDRRRRHRLAGLSGDVDAKQMEMRRPPLWDVWISSGKECWQDMMPLSVKVIHREAPTASPPEDVSEAAAPQATSPYTSPDYFPTYIASGRGIARVAGTPAFLNAPRRSPPQRQIPDTARTGARSTTATATLATTTNSNPRVPPTERSILDEFIRPMQVSWALLLRHLRGRGVGPDGEKDASSTGGGNGERGGEPVEALRVSVLIAMPAPARSLKSASGIVDEPDGRLFGEYSLGVLDVPWHDGKDCTFG